MNSKKRKSTTLLEELYETLESDTEDEDYVFKESIFHEIPHFGLHSIV